MTAGYIESGACCCHANTLSMTESVTVLITPSEMSTP